MTRRWKAWVGLALAFFLGSSLFAVWPSGMAEPDFVAAVVVAATLSGGPRLGASVGLAGGLATDLSLGRFIGLETTLLALLGWLAGTLRRSVFVESWLLSLGIAAAGIFLERLVLFAFYRMAGLAIAPFVPGVVGVTLETLPFYLVARWAFSRERTGRSVGL